MWRLANSFGRSREGSVAIIFASVLVVLAAICGGAIDLARYHSAKTQTRAAIDAAVLAGARVLLLTGDAIKAKAAAQEYYSMNVADRAPVQSDTVEFVITDNNTAITGSGDALLPTTLLKLAGIDTLSLVSQTGSGFAKAAVSGGGGGDLEVSVMLDVTGSMCDDGVGPCTSGAKLEALKTAAKDLVNIVVRDDQTEYKSRVALVPFAQRIRVAPNGQGGDLMKSMTNLDPTWSGWYRRCVSWQNTGPNGEVNTSYCAQWQVEYVSNWKVRPCVTERFYNSPWGMDLTDDMPGNNAWLNAEDGGRLPLSHDSATNPPTSKFGLTESDPAEHWTYNNVGSCNEPESNEVMRLTADKTALTSRIDALTGGGSTGGALGTVFSWFMLSPKWNSVWPSIAGNADPYTHLTITQPNGKPKLRKVAILMSDGVYNTHRAWSGQNQQYVSDNAKAVCAAMKAQGIEIYAVGFDLDSLPASERAIAVDTLQSCGSSLEHFYNTLTAEDLQGAFHEIAVILSNVSLVN